MLLYFAICFSHFRRSAYFFLNGCRPTEVSTPSLHDALPILGDHPDGCDHGSGLHRRRAVSRWRAADRGAECCKTWEDRKSTRLNSSHRCISYAVCCLKKKKTFETAFVERRQNEQNSTTSCNI